MTAEGKANDTRELEMGMAQMEQIKAQVESIRSQTASLQSILMDYSNSLEVMTSMIDGGSEDVLMPVGGSAFLKVKVLDTEKCLVDRGAGIFVETPIKEAREIMQERMGSIRNGISRMDGSIQELMGRYEEISRATQEIYNRQMMAGAGPETTF